MRYQEYTFKVHALLATKQSRVQCGLLPASQPAYFRKGGEGLLSRM